jgi:glucosamine 6-phosphate synthetase-like amidotransferase/phosphosugar isomerase protein
VDTPLEEAARRLSLLLGVSAERAAHAVAEVLDCMRQLFAYHAARAQGLDIDQPRNLAKSVTVT